MNQTAAEIYLHITQTKNIKYATPRDRLVRLCGSGPDCGSGKFQCKLTALYLHLVRHIIIATITVLSSVRHKASVDCLEIKGKPRVTKTLFAQVTGEAHTIYV